ncbi:MAG: MaoC family dehydratase [Pseudomonadota bacterium]
MSQNQSPFSPGQSLGTSPWLTVDQEMISGFGASTRDPDPMHVNPEWAQQYSPFGKTIAFGFLTMSLLTRFLYDVMGVEPDNEVDREALGSAHVMNYGFDRLRLVSPVPVGAKMRAVFSTKTCDVDEKGNERVVIDTVVEIEGEAKPALVADWVVVHVPAAVAASKAESIR